MRFEWDPEKARTNRIKHGIDFELATRVWDDSRHQIRPDQVIDGEERWRATGFVRTQTLLLVIFVERGRDLIRIISARKATPAERRSHEHEAL